MNLFKKIMLISNIEKAVKRIRLLMANSSETAAKLNIAVLNLKTDLEVLVTLLPSLKNIYKDIRESKIFW